MKRLFPGSWIKGWGLPQALLTAVVFLQSVKVLAAEPVVFRPAYAPGPADNPLKGFVPYARQGRKFPHSLEFDYLSLALMMTGPTTFDWAPMERLLDGIASRGCQSDFRTYMEFPRKPSGVPENLVKAGVKVRAWTNTNTQPIPPSSSSADSSPALRSTCSCCRCSR